MHPRPLLIPRCCGLLHGLNGMAHTWAAPRMCLPPFCWPLGGRPVGTPLLLPCYCPEAPLSIASPQCRVSPHFPGQVAAVRASPDCPLFWKLWVQFAQLFSGEGCGRSLRRCCWDWWGYKRKTKPSCLPHHSRHRHLKRPTLPTKRFCNSQKPPPKRVTAPISLRFFPPQRAPPAALSWRPAIPFRMHPLGEDL